MTRKYTQEEIEKQARGLMDSFLAELSAVSENEEFGLAREAQMREPRPVVCDEQFRQAFLANAPRTRDGLLIMEKKHW